MHARLTRYYLKVGAADDAVALMADRWLPLIRESPGFRSFQVIGIQRDSGYAPDGDQLVTLLEHDTREQSLDALEMAQEWIFKHVSHLLIRPSEMLMGDVLLSGEPEGTSARPPDPDAS